MSLPAPVSLRAAFLCLAGFCLFAATTAAAQENQPPIRRGSWAAFAEETEILSADDTVVRKAPAGEVVRVRIARDGWAEIGSSIPGLAGGKVKISSLRPSSPEENEAWLAAHNDRLAQAAKAAEPLASEPPPEEEETLEKAEAAATPLPPLPPPPPAPSLREPVIGWFSPGAATRVTGLAALADGRLALCGSAAPPFSFPAARAWKGELPGGAAPSETGSPPPGLPFIALFAPDLKSLEDFVVFHGAEEMRFTEIRAGPEGGLWVAARRPPVELVGPDAEKAEWFLLRFDSGLKELTRAMALLTTISQFALDPAGRPVVLTGSPKRHGGGFLTRYFSSGRYERKWPEAPDGPTRRLVLDFSSPALATGPFAIWAKRAEEYPDFPTPMGPWGAERNAGQPIVWTNVKSGKNPIRGADLKPEAIAIEKNGNVIVSGTIPFHMGFPDFDPFLMRFTPEGRLLWTNCFLTGLLSEPDQKTQALAIDPSNGDIIVCYWQHGNNRETLLLDPNGWLNRFTGTSGNIKITWIGRVEAGSGKLKHSTYIHARKPDPKNPGWPDLNSSTVEAMEVDTAGRVFAAGATTISFPTTSHAWLASVSEYGNHPMLAVLRPDLAAPIYSTYLSPGQGKVTHLALRPNHLAFCAGTHSTEETPLPVSNARDFPWLSDSPPPAQKDGVFIAIVPVPSEEAGWSF